jgi:hypothetical protein
VAEIYHTSTEARNTGKTTGRATTSAPADFNLGRFRPLGRFHCNLPRFDSPRISAPVAEIYPASVEARNTGKTTGRAATSPPADFNLGRFP